MSQSANIVAYDGAATPVAHTFYPVSVAREGAGPDAVTTVLYREQISTLPVYAQGTVVQTSKRLSSGVYRVSSRVSIPVLEAVAGQNSAGYTAAPKVAYTNDVEVTGFFHERSTIEEHRLARQLCLNIGGAIATSVTPVTTGSVPELFDLLVAPT